MDKKMNNIDCFIPKQEEYCLFHTSITVSQFAI